MNQQHKYANVLKHLFLRNEQFGSWYLPIANYANEYLHIYLDSPSLPLSLKSQRNIAMSEGRARITPLYSVMTIYNWVRLNYLFHELEGRSYLRYFRPIVAIKVDGSLSGGRAVYDLSNKQTRRALYGNIKYLSSLQKRFANEDSWISLSGEIYYYLKEFPVNECHNVIHFLASAAEEFNKMALQIKDARVVFVISPALRLNTLRPLGR